MPCLTWTFSGCNGQANGTDSTSGTLTEETTTGGDSVIKKIPLENLSSYSIVYPENSGEDLVKQAKALKDTIKNIYGKELTVKPDTIAAFGEFKETEFEILIGNTNRAQSKTYLEGLKLLDYGFTVIDNKIVIGAFDEYTATNAALDFSVNIVAGKKNSEFFYSTEWDKISRGKYSLDDLKINGIDIFEYKIVYPSASGNFEKQLAERLSLVVGAKAGYSVEVISDKTAKGTSPEILIGNEQEFRAYPAEASDKTGYINAGDKTVQLYGKTALANANAVNFIINSIESAAEKTLDIEISSQIVNQTDNETIGTMTYNIFTGDSGSAKIKRVIFMILKYLPDTFGVQEANNVLMNGLVDQLSGYYDYVGVARDDGKSGSIPQYSTRKIQGE